MTDDDPDGLVTVTTTDTEFQAGILVAVLEDVGIKAFSFGAVAAMEPYGKRLMPVVVQVRREDFEKAKAALVQNVADSVDLDWDEVDVGERVDDLPLTETNRMPFVPRLALILAVLLLVVVVVLTVLRLAAGMP